MYTTHYTQHVVHCTPCTLHYTLATMYRTLYNLHTTQYNTKISLADQDRKEALLTDVNRRFSPHYTCYTMDYTLYT